jgi:hypothetical protein
MKISIQAPAPTDIPFDGYAAALESSISETYAQALDIDDIEIVRADGIAVLFDGKASKSAEARDIVSAARWFAKPGNITDYFA